jgi:ribosome biogenesis GTPase
MTAPVMTVGLVLRIDAKCVHVEIDGSVHQLPLRGRLFEEPSYAKQPIAPGDRVELTLPSAGSGGAIDRVLPRGSRFSRRAAGEAPREQVVAANVARVVIVMPVREPPFDALLVDRLLAAAERESLEAVLVVSKIDLDEAGRAPAWIELYRELGYSVLPTSVRGEHTTEASLADLRARIHSGITVLCGPSGAGKSSLINALVPGVDLRVGALGKLRQGQHTTTHAQLVPLPGGGHVLDTPGVRSFRLFAVNAQEIAFYFRDIKALAPQCAYRNCTHRTEPGCAVRGRVAPTRLRSYHHLHEEAGV